MDRATAFRTIMAANPQCSWNEAGVSHPNSPGVVVPYQRLKAWMTRVANGNTKIAVEGPFDPPNDMICVLLSSPYEQNRAVFDKTMAAVVALGVICDMGCEAASKPLAQTPPVKPASAQNNPSNNATYYVANATPPDAFLSLRTEPTAKSGSRLMAMPNGTKLQVLERRPNGWWRVRVTDSGQEGWALSAAAGKTWIEGGNQTAATSRPALVPRQASNSAAADIASLKRGTYVITQVPCEQAANVSIMNFDGNQFFGGRFCPAPVAGKSGAQFAITRPCPSVERPESEEEANKTEDQTETFAIKSANAFVMKNGIGEFAYRFCEQAALPQIWRGAVTATASAPAAKFDPYKVQELLGRPSPAPSPVAKEIKRDVAGIKLGMTRQQLVEHLKKEGCSVSSGSNITNTENLWISCSGGTYRIQSAGALPNNPIYEIQFGFCSGQTPAEVGSMLRQRYSVPNTGTHDQWKGDHLGDGIYFNIIESWPSSPNCPAQSGFTQFYISDSNIFKANQQALDNARRSVVPPRF
jgi:hypothetical protein